MKTRYQILDDELLDVIANAPREDQADWLILSPSQEYQGYWAVDCLYDDFFFHFEELVGRYRIVSPARIDEFLSFAEDQGYHVAFAEDPMIILDAYAELQKPPPFELISDLEGTEYGFYPWQIVGFNKLVRDESLSAGLAVWDTGAGKTALIAAALQWHLTDGHPFDLALVVVKTHNKIETQRKLLSLAGIESIVIDGTPEKRAQLYASVHAAAKVGPMVMIVNYEKLRDDSKLVYPLLNKRRCLFYWDEMPAKLSSRDTLLYKAAKQTLYHSFFSKPRPSWMRHLVLSATPIENDPDGLYSCVNLVFPRLLGPVTAFHAQHVLRRNWINRKPELWHNLDQIEAKLDFITHRVSKDDPDVAAMFPDVIRDPKIIDWHPKHREVYDQLTGKAKEMMAGDFSESNILSLIQVMQMLCDAPSMVKASAENRARFNAALAEFGDLEEADVIHSGPKGSDVALQLVSGLPQGALTDVGHTKLEMWKDIITVKHPDDKIVTHSTWAEYIFPVWEYWLQEWDISYVIFSGTDKQKQTALDRFRDDSSIQMFLSGDAGADSIDIPQASVGVNYNGPWKWVTEKQREGRRDRVNSTFKTIYTYSLMMADSFEERKKAIRDMKHSYHQAIFEGRAVESALSARYTRSDLMYMLIGETDD